MDSGDHLGEARLGSAAFFLRLGIAVQCATLGWLALSSGTSLNTLLFMELGMDESRGVLADQVLAGVLFAAVLGVIWRPLGVGGSSVGGVAALAAGAAFLVVSIATRATGGQAFSELSPPALATRWLAPLALSVLVLGTARDSVPSVGRQRLAAWVLRVAVASTFLIHGWEAVSYHPAFVDLLIGSARRWMDAAPSEAQARVMLMVIGVADIVVALLLVSTRWRWVLAWATIWGALTALSRTVALGSEFAHEALIRSMNALAPLSLWLLTCSLDSVPLLGRGRAKDLT